MIRTSSRPLAITVVALLIPLLLEGSAFVESPVADAAMRGEKERVRALVRAGADVNDAQGDGMTALHWAAQRGDDELARILLYAGAQVAQVTRLGDYTPLHLAAMAGQPAVVQILLDVGADLSAVTSTGGATALHLAAGADSVMSIRSLLKHGCDVNARESRWGQTPLMFAASRGRTAAVQALVEGGADLAAVTKVEDVVALAAEKRVASEVRNHVLSIFRGDEPEGTSWQPSPGEVQAAVRAAKTLLRAKVPEVSGRSSTGGTPLDQDLGTLSALSASDDRLVMASGVKLPVEAYDPAFPNLVGTHGGLTALLHAVREGHGDTALVLVQAGAEIDQTSNGDHTSPILMAVINGYFDLAMDLLVRGADPNVASDAGATPLFAAISTQWAPKARYPQQLAHQQQRTTYLDLMWALLKAGAEPNARLTKHLWYLEYTFSHLGIDTRGATPFWRAAHALDLEAMRMLVAYGGSPNIPTIRPPEPRQQDFRDGEQLEDLSGLLPVPSGGPGVWPVHAAAGHGYGIGYAGNSHRHVPDGWLAAMKYLVDELGGDVNARDHDGFTALHKAAARGDNTMILFLVKRGGSVTAVSRRGHTTADMANGPSQRTQPFPTTITLLESLGAKNNHNCVSC